MKKNYEEPILAFRAPCLVRFPHATDQGKLTPRFEPGIFLGKSWASVEHIIGIAMGIVCSRTIVPMADEEAK